MNTYEKKSIINCNIEKLFNFHLDVNNLNSITPKNSQIEVKTKDYEANIGRVMKLENDSFIFFKGKWEVKIIKLEYPNVLVHYAMKSPFKFWEHSHIFTRKGNKTELRDIVKYIPPFGIIGRIFNFLLVQKLEYIFTYRHNMTKKLLEKAE